MSFDDLVFSSREPAEGQRWSTWTAITPSERGPQPWPDWLVTSAAAFDTELGIVKSGKEADVFLIERAVPDDPSASSILAAKRYRSADTTDFHRSSQYQEGRRTRRSRDSRAVAKKSTYGRAFAAGQWAMAEFAALCELHTKGLPVPYPVQVNGTEILMEFVGRDGVAAPRLAQVRPTPAELADYADQVIEIVATLARAGYAHGDIGHVRVRDADAICRNSSTSSATPTAWCCSSVTASMSASGSPVGVSASIPTRCSARWPLRRSASGGSGGETPTALRLGWSHDLRGHDRHGAHSGTGQDQRLPQGRGPARGRLP